MKKKLFIFGLFALMLFLPNRNVLAIGLSVEVSSVNIYDEEIVTYNDDETAMWDPSSKTLELNNYNGGGILLDVIDPVNLVLKGTNVVDGDSASAILSYSDLSITGDGTLEIVNSSIGLEVDEGDLTINSGLITITAPVLAGINVSYLENTEKGNITISSDLVVENGANIGIYAERKLTLDSGTIKSFGSMFGIDASKIIVNKASVYAKADLAALATGDLLEINGGYVEAEGGAGENTGVGVLAMDTPSTEFLISDNMEMIPNDISLQKVTVDFFGEMDVIVYGKDGIEVDFESAEAPFKNVANKVIFKEKR